MAEKKVITKTVTTEEVHHKKSNDKKKIVKKGRASLGEGVGKKTASVVRVEKQLMENFVSLQKVLTGLSGKFEAMTDRLSGVLDLFEDAAKSFVKKESSSNVPSVDWEKEITSKMDSLFEQNKILARGLTLIHEEAVKANQPSIMERNTFVPVPVKAESFKSPPQQPKPTAENIQLNNKPRVKEEEPIFDVEEPPFPLRR